MQRDFSPRFTRDELVEATGIPARTIRFYIEKGLAPPALGKGKTAYYTSDHVEALTRVRELRAENLSTEEIRGVLQSPDPDPRDEIDGESWIRIPLHQDLELHVRAGAPEHVHELARQARQFAEQWLGEGRD